MNLKSLLWAVALFAVACGGETKEPEINTQAEEEAPAEVTAPALSPVTAETARYHHLTTTTTLTWTKYAGDATFAEYRIYAETGAWNDAPEVTTESTLVTTIKDVDTVSFTIAHGAAPTAYSFYRVFAVDVTGATAGGEAVRQNGLHLPLRTIENGSFVCPDGIQFRANGNVLIGEWTQGVFEYTPAGSYVTTHGTDRNNDPYYGLELADGNLLISGYSPGELVWYTPAGTRMYASAASGPGLPYIASNGAMYVPFYDVNKLAYYAPGSTVPTAYWGGPGSAGGQFNQPWEIWGDGSELFVVDPGNNRVQVLDMSGGYKREFGKTGTHKCETGNCWGMALTQDDLVYVVDGDTKILIYKKDGTFVDRIPGSRFGSQWSWGANFSPDGQFYLARCGAEKDVQVFGP